MPRLIHVRPGAPRVLSLVFILGLLSLTQVPGALYLFRPTAYAATAFTVNSTGDGADSNLGDGVCDDGTGHCTLRAAIQQANATAGTDTINITVTGTINLASALPDVTTDMTINGPGANLLTVRRDTGGNYRVLTIQSGATVNISGLTASNGRTPDGRGAFSDAGNGGGIFNAGALSLAGVTVSGNLTGNGIFIDSSTANWRGGDGGGIANTGTITLTGVTVSGNKTGTSNRFSLAGGRPSGGDGAGLFNSGTMTLTNSTVSGNQTGIGIINGTPTGDAGDGSGISNVGTLTVINSTVTANDAGWDTTAANWGWGLTCSPHHILFGTATIGNSIIAGNTGNSDITAGSNENEGHINSLGHNIIKVYTGSDTGIHLTSTDITGQDPQLGPLADNGGPTQTHALLAGSLAIDAGDNSLAVDANNNPLTTDQRGAGFPRISRSAVDIGAFESQSFVVNSTADTDDGSCAAAGVGNGCTLREAINAANSLSGAEINFDPSLTAGGPATINLTGALPDIASNMTINGPGSGLLTVRRNTGGDYRVLTIPSGVKANVSGLTVTNGKTPDGPSGYPGANAPGGGGIHNAGTLTLTDITVTANSTGKGGDSNSYSGSGSSGGSGGGVYNSGTLTMTNCAVTGNVTGRPGDNSAGGHGGMGGGIYSEVGSLSLTKVIVSNNLTGDSGNTAPSYGGHGGGIFIQSGTAILTSSTVSGNKTGHSTDGGYGFGGGIENWGSLAITGSTISGNTGVFAGGVLNWSTLTMTNSTVSGNGSLSDTGNGIYNGFSPATLSLTNCTVTNNMTGVTTFSSTPPVVSNTIIAGNGGGGFYLDALGSFNSQGHNLIGSNNGGTGFNATGDQVGTNNSPIDPRLGPLANNGGPTQTHALLPGSPAINAGANSLAVDAGNSPLTTDQRGVGFPRVVNTTVDIGAVEVNYAISATAGTPQSASINTAFATLLKATVTESGNARSNIPVTFTAPANGAGGTFGGNAAATVNTDSNGVATAPTFNANATAGGPYNVVASLAGGAPSANFALTNTKGNQTITFGPLAGKTFGDVDFQLSATASSGLPVGFSPSGNCTVSGSTVHVTGAGSCTITASQGGDSNYNPAPNVQQAFQIGKADQTITVTTHAPPSAALNSTFTVAAMSNSGLLISYSSSGACTNSGTTFTMTAASGTCKVMYDQAGNGNFNAAAQLSESVSALKANQTISFGALSNKTFGDPDFQLSAAASSGLAVSFAATGNCALSGGSVHINGAGSCTVTASQSGDSNYNPAPDVQQTFQIAKANQTIAFGALSNRTFGDADFNVSATGGASGNPVTFSASGNCTVSGSTVHITGAGLCTITASQAGDSNYNAAIDVQQFFKIAQALTATALSSSANPSAPGQSVTFTAAVSSSVGTPTGAVTFKDGGTTIGGCMNVALGSGQAACTTSALSLGSHTITAEYSGNSNFVTSSATLSAEQVVGGVINYSQAIYTVNERDGSITITVARTGDTTQAASVDYSTDDGSNPFVFVPCSTVTGLASERCDYTRAAGTLNFAAGETQKTFVVLVSDDSYTEGTEIMRLSLSHPVGATLGQQPFTTLQIMDDAQQTTNPVDDPTFFVTQHYHDFLNRAPDSSGLQFWTGGITGCGSDANCVEVHRVNTSAAFFLSIEFQQTGYLVERIYKASFGDATGNSTLGGAHQLGVPVVRFAEFLRDTQEIESTPTQVIVGQGNWQQQLDANKNAFALEFVSRQRFTNAFPSTLTADQFVNQLNTNTGGVLTPADIAQLDSVFGGASASSNDAAKRAQVLRAVAENATLQQRESDSAFVLMQFFGYLRRNPDDAPDSDYTGYDFWLSKLNQFHGDYVKAEMVKAFITSTEYRQRFGN